MLSAGVAFSHVGLFPRKYAALEFVRGLHLLVAVME
jgi:hypothetical protein